MIKDLVSIITPCYNGEKHLEQYFNAILNQTYEKIEVIFIDDGSTDKTKEIVEKYKEKLKKRNISLRYIYQENAGQAVAINKGLSLVQGEFLVWPDADDYYENDAIETMVSYLNNNKEMDFARGKSAFRNDSDKNKIIFEGKSKYPNETKIFDFYVYETDSYTYPGIFIVRMNFFDKCIKNRKIYESRGGQNWQLILPLAYNGNCGYIDKIVYNYIINSNSHYHSVKKMKELIKRCDVHKDILFHTIDAINMSKQESKKYKRGINKKYIKVKIKIILSKIKNIIFKGRKK